MIEVVASWELGYGLGEHDGRNATPRDGRYLARGKFDSWDRGRLARMQKGKVARAITGSKYAFGPPRPSLSYTRRTFHFDFAVSSPAIRNRAAVIFGAASISRRLVPTQLS